MSEASQERSIELDPSREPVAKDDLVGHGSPRLTVHFERDVTGSRSP
jgi:hypothetical protein